MGQTGERYLPYSVGLWKATGDAGVESCSGVFSGLTRNRHGYEMSVEHARLVTVGTSGDPLEAEAVQGPGIRVVVQQRQRLFREGISQLLDAEGDVDVVATARSDGDALAACRDHHPSA